MKLIQITHISQHNYVYVSMFSISLRGQKTMQQKILQHQLRIKPRQHVARIHTKAWVYF